MRDFHLPIIVDPKPNDFKFRIMRFQPRNSLIYMFTVLFFIYGVPAAIMMAYKKDAFGSVSAHRDINAAKDLIYIDLRSYNSIHARFSDNIHKIDVVLLADPMQDRQLHAAIHAVQACRTDTSIVLFVWRSSHISVKC